MLEIYDPSKRPEINLISDGKKMCPPTSKHQLATERPTRSTPRPFNTKADTLSGTGTGPGFHTARAISPGLTYIPRHLARIVGQLALVSVSTNGCGDI